MIRADLGHLGIEKLHENSRIPKKGSRLHKLNRRDKAYNRRLARERAAIEHINAKIKTFKSMAEPVTIFVQNAEYHNETLSP
ncbi:MAG: hypothetical protein LBU85_07365 [Treponema sp.]|nr:hypothetical protein [Treponema sp.]